MSTLRVEPNERIDYGDFNFAVAEAMDAAVRQESQYFLTNPLAAVRSWILSGFGMTNLSGKQLTVTLGRALLAARINGTVQYGYISAEGDVSKTIDMGPLAATTYNVYLRFEMVDGDSSSRVFWNPAGSGSEFTSTVTTRRNANWSIRVETSNPGAEWLQIGTANNVGASLVLVDQRNFYFEGSVPSTYPSGWSSDGGGVANDRNANRATYGVADLQTFTAATRQCLEDIKGRGLRRWWDRDIGGMNIGFDAAPVEDRLAVGDASFNLYHTAAGVGSTPEIAFDTGNDRLQYLRTSNEYDFQIAGVTEARIKAAGLAVANGIYVGDVTGAPTDNDIYAEGTIEAVQGLFGTGLAAGYGVYGVGSATVGTAGVYGVGNYASSSGVEGHGGVANSFGVQGFGKGTYSGVRGIGDPAYNANGIQGIGGGSGSGVEGYSAGTGIGVYGLGPSGQAGNGVRGDGQYTGSNGVIGYGNVGNSTGVRGLGKGTSAGVVGTGDPTSNAIGVFGSGSGTGAGVEGDGGATGIGGTFYGGATSGSAVEARAQGGNSWGLLALGKGVAAAVRAYADSGSNANGVQGDGGGTGSGVSGKGGDTSGAGVEGTGGLISGPGVAGFGGSPSGNGGYFKAYASGSASGVYAEGGSTNGYGLEALGHGTGYGVYATGGSSNAAGVRGVGGGTGPGVTGFSASGKGVVGSSTSSYGGTFGTSSVTKPSFRLEPQPTLADGDGLLGDIYMNANGKLYVHNGVNWVIVGTQS